MRFADFILLETLLNNAFSQTFYHGTPVANVSSILKKGIIPNKPQATAAKGAYLTTDFELAAKYAVGAYNKETPAVLEINLSSPKRFKKLAQDPLDQSDSSWEMEPGYGSDDLYDVQKQIERFIQNYIPHYWFNWPRNLDKGLQALDGFDVYRLILGILEKNLPNFSMLKQQIKSQMQKCFAPGQFGEYLEITPSGTFRVYPNYYTTWEQSIYPQRIPPAAIKHIWVRQQDFPNAQGTVDKKGIKYLPWQARAMLEEIESLYNTIADDLDKLDEEQDEENFHITWWIEQLNDYVRQISDNTEDQEFKGELEDIIQSLENGEKIQDIPELAERIRDHANDIRNEDWGSEKVFGHANWVQIQPSNWRV